VLECRPKPDPSNDQELNTFLSLYTEPTVLESFADIPLLFQKMQVSENVKP